MAATRTIATLIDPASRPTIVYESTVYPGVTEDICGPEIERQSGLQRGRDFRLGYSPERINPGDREHTIDRITKVIAGEDEEVVEQLAAIYGSVTSGGVFRAASIKAAEAAKAIENAQRDINIAFMNEVTQIFSKIGLSAWDVLEAARTSGISCPSSPGLSAATASASTLITSVISHRNSGTIRRSSCRAGAPTTAWVAGLPTRFTRAAAAGRERR